VFAKWFSTTRASGGLATATATHDLTPGSLQETIVTSISVFSRVRILPLIRFAVSLLSRVYLQVSQLFSIFALALLRRTDNPLATLRRYAMSKAILPYCRRNAIETRFERSK
jgi:hypothetical protein